MSEELSLYSRLGGYDAIAAVSENLVGRLMADPLLGRFWANRSDDGIRREKQLLIDFLCQSAGGLLFYGSVQESEQARIFTGCRHPGSWKGNAHLTPGNQLDSSVYRPFNEDFANQGTE